MYPNGTERKRPTHSDPVPSLPILPPFLSYDQASCYHTSNTGRSGMYLEKWLSKDSGMEKMRRIWKPLNRVPLSRSEFTLKHRRCYLSLSLLLAPTSGLPRKKPRDTVSFPRTSASLVLRRAYESPPPLKL